MTYRKFKADYLFTGRELAADDAVLITSEEGVVDAILPLAAAGEGVEHYSGLLSPGFVNCHCHLELSHLKGILPEGMGLVDFLLAVIRQRYQPQESIRACIVAAEQAMLEAGIVAVGDICNTADTLPEKVAGRLYYHNFIETIGFNGAGAAERLAGSRKVYESFTGAGANAGAASGASAGAAAGAIAGTSSIVPHAPYSVSPELFRLIADLPGNRLLTIHNQEDEAENVFYRSGAGDLLRLFREMGLDISFWKGTGKNSLESFLPFFHAEQTLILVHNVATTAADIKDLPGVSQTGVRQTGVPELFFCLCPNANLYIGGQLPAAELFRQTGLSMVIGTDSLASNHQLSVLEEIKTLQRAFPLLSTPTLLEWATWNGARALQQEANLGSFQPGKKPGVLLIGDLEAGMFTKASEVRRLV
jgi:aminodeoxyfutalosine deaminase